MSKLEFSAEMAKQLRLRGWDYKKLAEVTGYTHGTIRTMMCDNTKLTPQAMKKFADVLGIEVESCVT